MSEKMRDEKRPHDRFRELELVDCGYGITKFIDTNNRDAWIVSKGTIDLEEMK